MQIRNRKLFGQDFTLIELLTVIAIIMILVALLLPVLGRVRKKAMIVKCISNEKQIGVAVSDYLSDADNIYPRVGGSWLGLAGVHSENAATYVEGEDGERPLNSYLSYEFDVLRCPLDKGDQHKKQGNSCFEFYGVSYMGAQESGGRKRWYGIKYIFAQSSAPFPRMRMSKVESPTEKVVLADCPFYRNRDMTVDKNRWHHDKLMRRFAVLWADGHVAEFTFPLLTCSKSNQDNITNGWGYY